MTYRIVHTYHATVHHHGIMGRGMGPTMTSAFNAALDHYATNTKSHREGFELLERLASGCKAAKRGFRDWLGNKVSIGRSFAKIERI